MATFRSWFDGLFRRGRVERDLADEVAFHLEARAEHWQRQGLTPAEARRRARLEFGAIDRYQEERRQARGLRWIDELRADLRYAARTLRGAPVFTAVAVAILAIGIGANTAVVSVVEAVMLRLLPVARPHELRELAWVAPRDAGWNMSYDGSMRPHADGGRIATSFAYPVYEALRARAAAFSALFAFTNADLTVDAGRGARRTPVLLVSGTFLGGLGTSTLIGRGIGPEDDRVDAPAVAVLSHRLWQRDFDGTPDAIGRTIRVNGTPAVVVGVLRPSFDGIEPGSPVDVLLPLTPAWMIVEGSADRLASAGFWGFRVMGRLRPGVADDPARAEADAILKQALPPTIAGAPAETQPRLVLKPGAQGLDSLRRSFSTPLSLLAAIMAAVLLIACANIAGLLLTRAAARAREIELRLALGASRGRVVRQLLTESLLLSALGAAAGLGLAWLVRTSLLPAINGDEDPIDLAVGFGGWVLAFSMGLSLIVGLACGLLPAVRATRSSTRLAPTRAVGDVRGARLFAGKTLVALQVALSLVLLVTAGLFTRSLINLRSQALGFRPDHLLVFQLDATTARYEGERLYGFYEGVLARVAGMPGVERAGFSRHGLLAGGATTDNLSLPDDPSGTRRIKVHVHFVSPGYLATMGIPLLAGRDLTSTDRAGAPRVGIVNQALARALGPTSSPVGRSLRLGAEPLEVVGQVTDARFASVRDPAPPTIYLPFRQHRQHRMTFVARVTGDPVALVAPLRAAVAELDPNVPIHAVRTQEEQIASAMRQERVFAVVASGFAVLAVLLSCLGLYGTLAYGVARRVPEIGVRMALGASRASVVGLILRESLIPVAAGAAAGVAVALVASRFLESLLFGVEPRDPATIAATTLILLLAALLAAWLPSRRASSVDPVAALRSE